MKMTRLLIPTVVLLLAMACAAPQTAGPLPGVPPAGETGEAAVLSRLLADESHRAEFPALLLKRGRIYREGSGKLARELPQAEQAKAFDRIGGGYLLAMQDFEAVGRDFPSSPEAAEALFELGRTYDYPYLSVFDLARGFYREVQEKYPNSPAAMQARQRLEIFEKMGKGMKVEPAGSQ